MSIQPSDETVLIDSLLNRLDADAQKELQRRVAGDSSLAKLRQDLANTLAALDRLPAHEPPADLVSRTLARIRQVKQTDALLAREEIGRTALRPTFSLAEAVGVAAAILIVASIVVPSMQQARRTTQVGQCSSNLGQVGASLVSYANSNGGKLPNAADSVHRWIPGGQYASNSAGLFKLVAGGYAAASLFACPAAGSGRNYNITKDMRDFPSAGDVQYSYQHTVGSTPISLADSRLKDVAGRMAILADSTPFYRDGCFKVDDAEAAASENHSRTGQNVLYLSQHVEWAQRPSVGVGDDNIYTIHGCCSYQGDEAPTQPTDTFLLPAYSSR